MIRSVTIRRFKQFKEERFDLPGHIPSPLAPPKGTVVLAGPNNCGKTTVLQAIAAWGLAFKRWKELNDFERHRGAFTKAPIARQAFHAVPLRAFDLLWSNRDYRGAIEIEVRSTTGWKIGMELVADSSEQIYVRPSRDVLPATAQEVELETVFVPAMSGLSTTEPVYQRPKLDQLLGQGKPGDVLRNLLVAAYRSQTAWAPLQESIRRLFGSELLPLDDSVADIVAEYRIGKSGKRFDIASAGSGFQQVLMLLTLLHTRPGAVLLIDEPDAHLDVFVEEAIYSELRSVAVKQNSQLVLATHSEVIINSVEPEELCMLLDRPRTLGSAVERRKLAASLRILTQTEILQALEAPGVLYIGDATDVQILCELAKVLGHPALETLTTRLFWKKLFPDPRRGTPGIRSRDHYKALKLVRPDLPALEIADGADRRKIQPTRITGRGFQQLRWKFYEIESYLFHPAALARFVTKTVGSDAAAKRHIANLKSYLDANWLWFFVKDPLGDHPFLRVTNARTELIAPALTAAGLPAIPYTSYHEIAAVMKPEEIHSEVREKLDAIQKAFRL